MDEDHRELAGELLRFVHGVTRQPMIVCDGAGCIVEVVDRKRIVSTHARAQRILRGEVDGVFVTAEEAARNPRMRAHD